MAEETTTEETTAETGKEESGRETTDDQRVPYERFQQANKKAKDAADKASKLEKDLADLRAQLEEREQQGLPELDRLKKSLDAAEKRAQEADGRAEKAEQERERTRRERWVAAAAAEQDFIDPDDANRYVDLDEIEDADQAARAVKAVAKKKQHLLKSEEPKLPGRVLENGRQSTTTDGKPKSNINLDAEAQMVSDELAKFLKNRQS